MDNLLLGDEEGVCQIQNFCLWMLQPSQKERKKPAGSIPTGTDFRLKKRRVDVLIGVAYQLLPDGINSLKK